MIAAPIDQRLIIKVDEIPIPWISNLKPFIPTTQFPSCKSFLRYSSSWTASCKSAIDFTSSLSSQWKESSILPLIHLDVSTFCKNSKSFRWVFLLIEDVATMTQFDLDANAVLRATTSGTGLTSQNDLSTVEKCLVLRRAAAETWLISNDSSQAIGSLYSWIVFLMLAPPPISIRSSTFLVASFLRCLS